MFDVVTGGEAYNNIFGVAGSTGAEKLRVILPLEKPMVKVGAGSGKAYAGASEMGGKPAEAKFRLLLKKFW
jgi:phosphoribosylformylglycinamidine (FGAM) synthase-like enzyme